jgi:hypothetical protein
MMMFLSARLSGLCRPSLLSATELCCYRRLASTFTFAGPRSLKDILKTELLQDRTRDDIQHLWTHYHADKPHVLGLVRNGLEGQKLARRAQESPFFLQPVFRDDGYFMLVSQFQSDAHCFLMAYLEDYKLDPARATPLLTVSVFNDYADSLDLSLVRCDVVNTQISMREAELVVMSTLQAYTSKDKSLVYTFNHHSADFDVQEYVARQNQWWKEQP